MLNRLADLYIPCFFDGSSPWIIPPVHSTHGPFAFRPLVPSPPYLFAHFSGAHLSEGPAAFALAVPSTSSKFLLLCTRGSQAMTRCVHNSLRILRFLQSKERVRNYPCHQSGTRTAGPKASLNRLTRQRKLSSYMWEHMQQDTETCNSLSISDCNPFATQSTLLKKPESCAMARCRSNYLGQHARCPEQEGRWPCIRFSTIR